MTEKQTPAQDAYKEACENLEKFCAGNTELSVYIKDDEYPIQVQFVPNPQLSVFGNENIDENGEVNELTVTVGLSTSVTSTLKFKMDSALLKKLIKYAEAVGVLHLHAFREEQGERYTPKRPTEPNAAGDRRCPGCRSLIPAPEEEPDYCQYCGQALDWTIPLESDEFEAKLEKLREIVGEKEAEQ